MRVHFLGIGGSGASAVAAIAEAYGYEVTGCDKNPHTEFTESFDKEALYTGHSKEHLKDAEILAITPAITSLDPNNEELVEAKRLGIEVLTWQEFMGKYLHKDKFVIAICGTHGKSTTTAMIGQLLEDAGLDPTVELGAIVPKWGSNYRVGSSKYFVTEADEFNDNFLSFNPDICVVTTIEFDHPEFFKDFEEYKESFRKFLSSTKIKIIANISDPGVNKTIISDKQSHTGSGAVDKVKDYHFPEIVDYSKSIDIDLPLKVGGEHNKLNALAAFQVGLSIGLDANTIRGSLMNFTGIGRRFEHIGDFNGAQIYSDFAHHPTEIKVTIEAARNKFLNKKIWVIFQPHMFSRTKALFNDFVKVFQDLPADQVSIIDIYPSREVDTGIVNSKELVDAISKKNITYLTPKDEVERFIRLAARKDQVIFFVGAGDIDQVARRLV